MRWTAITCLCALVMSTLACSSSNTVEATCASTTASEHSMPTSSPSVTRTLPQFNRQNGPPELHHDFAGQSDGTPVTADSGQAWTLTYGPTSASKPTVSNGQFVIDTTAPGVAAGYLTAPLAASITWMEADFDFTSGAGVADGAAGLIAWAKDLQSGEMGDTLPSTPAHVAFVSTGFTFFVGSVCLTSLGFTNYGATYKSQHVEVAIDKPNSTAYVRGADGSIHAFRHYLIGSISAPYATAEVFYNAADTDNRVQFRQFAATSKSVSG